MSIILKINTVDKSSLVDWPSLQKTEMLTKEPDTLVFRMRNSVARGYTPALNDEVQVYDDGSIIFGGLITEIINDIDGLLQYTEIRCIDYTVLLNRLLVAQTYSSTTAEDIVDDIISTFTTGFTTTNVVAPDSVDSFKVNYLTVSQALQKLAELIGGYDWYVDYNKDIHFFLPADNAAPFNLDDTGGKFMWNTLNLQTNSNQIRNDIIVRGGETVGTAVENIQVADGVQVVFFVGYNLSSFLAYKALAATPTSFVALTVGADGVDNPASFDTLYNPNKGLLIFPSGTKPAVSDRIKYTGVPVFPLIAELQDPVSIATYGRFQYVIVDTTIVTKLAAKARALAQVIEYSNPLLQGSFKTISKGLVAGQTITINSTIRGVNDDYKIQRITTTIFSPAAGNMLLFEVEIVSTQKLTMIDVLNKLLVRDVSDQIVIGVDEVVDLLVSDDETITIGESVATSISHNPQTETMSVGESTTVQSLNYAIIFVFGVQAPSGFKRQFVVSGSPLG